MIIFDKKEKSVKVYWGLFKNNPFQIWNFKFNLDLGFI